VDVLTPATPGGIIVGANEVGITVPLPPDGERPPGLKAVVPKEGDGGIEVGIAPIFHGGVPPGQPPGGGGVYMPSK